MFLFRLPLIGFEVVEEHRASRVDVGELEEHLPDVRRWDIHAKVKDRIDQFPQVEPPTRSREMTCNHVTDLVGNVLQQVISTSSVCCICVNMA